MSRLMTPIDVSPRKTGIEEEEDDMYVDEKMSIPRKRGCLYKLYWIPSSCFGLNHSSSPRGSWERIPYSRDHRACPRWLLGWSKIREWSELVAGPKWKTFIRRFRKNYYYTKSSGYKRWGTSKSKFQYDLESYALNFDEGLGKIGDGDDLDDGYLSRDFSCRYASIPASAKSSMDLGKDGPSFM